MLPVSGVGTSQKFIYCILEMSLHLSSQLFACKFLVPDGATSVRFNFMDRIFAYRACSLFIVSEFGGEISLFTLMSVTPMFAAHETYTRFLSKNLTAPTNLEGQSFRCIQAALFYISIRIICCDKNISVYKPQKYEEIYIMSFNC